MTKQSCDDKLSTRRTYILLQSALFILMTEKPFEKITLIELCDRAMVPRSTFYRYFEDKHDLLRYGINTFFETAKLTDELIYFKDVYSIRNFLLTLIHMIDRNRRQYHSIYQTNKNGELMDILKHFLSDILIMKLKESEQRGVRLNLSPNIFIYLLTDFYFSAARGYLDMSDICSVDSYVDDVCKFTDKELFVTE